MPSPDCSRHPLESRPSDSKDIGGKRENASKNKISNFG